MKNLIAHLAVAASLGVSAPIALASPSQPAAAEHSERLGTPTTTAAVTPAQSDDAARYAAMEKKDAKPADFRGGDTVVIAMSTGAVIVAVILLVLLL